jgi:hypothetical protein
MKAMKAFLATAIGVSVLGSGSICLATVYQRLHASACRPTTNWNGAQPVFGGSSDNWFEPNGGGADGWVDCAVVDSSAFPKASITAAYADVQVLNGGSAQAVGCVTFYDQRGFGEFCGATTGSVSGNGHHGLNVCSTGTCPQAWSSSFPSDYPFITVQLIGQDTNLEGVYMQY